MQRVASLIFAGPRSIFECHKKLNESIYQNVAPTFNDVCMIVMAIITYPSHKWYPYNHHKNLDQDEFIKICFQKSWKCILFVNANIRNATHARTTAPAYSGADKKHQSSASLALLRGIHRWSVNSQRKRPVTRKMCAFDDVIIYMPNAALS